jgi:hypothetical protein
MNDILVEHYPRSLSYVLNEDVSVQEFRSSDRLLDNFLPPLSAEALGELIDLQLKCAQVYMTETNDS